MGEKRARSCHCLTTVLDIEIRLKTSYLEYVEIDNDPEGEERIDRMNLALRCVVDTARERKRVMTET